MLCNRRLFVAFHTFLLPFSGWGITAEKVEEGKTRSSGPKRRTKGPSARCYSNVGHPKLPAKTSGACCIIPNLHVPICLEPAATVRSGGSGTGHCSAWDHAGSAGACRESSTQPVQFVKLITGMRTHFLGQFSDEQTLKVHQLRTSNTR